MTNHHLAKLTIQLLLREPFFGHFLTGMIKEVTDQVGSLEIHLAVGKSLTLKVNPQFWQQTEEQPEWRYGLLKHEVLHLVFKHPLTIRDYDHKKIYHIAADLAANQYIQDDQLPADAITWDLFPDLRLSRGQTVGYYYQKLLAAWQDLIQKAEEDLSGSEKALRQLILQGSRHLDKHRPWNDLAERWSQAESKVLEGMMNQAVTTAARRVGEEEIGHLPGHLQSYLQQFLVKAKPQVNWRRMLRLFTTGSSRTDLKNTLRRPSKRYGTVPGIKVKHRTKILVALDTSGSIHDRDLDRFFEEVYHLWRQGAEIKVVECDVSIRRKYDYKGRAPRLISGRGGTDFNAPIAYANEIYHPDAVVYFTDGLGPIPRTPSRFPMLWLITSNGIPETNPVWAALPGRKVKMGGELKI